jgi:putative transposase
VSTGESEERAERRARQRELADRPNAAGALDGIFEQIDAGEVPLGGDEGFLKGILKAALGRGLDVELTDHVGYERGDPNASLFANSRNGSTPKIVSSEIGDLDLAVPGGRNSTFAPQLVPKGSRRKDAAHVRNKAAHIAAAVALFARTGEQKSAAKRG